MYTLVIAQFPIERGQSSTLIEDGLPLNENRGGVGFCGYEAATFMFTVPIIPKPLCCDRGSALDIFGRRGNPPSPFIYHI